MREAQKVFTLLRKLGPLEAKPLTNKETEKHKLRLTNKQTGTWTDRIIKRTFANKHNKISRYKNTTYEVKTLHK